MSLSIFYSWNVIKSFNFGACIYFFLCIPHPPSSQAGLDTKVIKPSAVRKTRDLWNPWDCARYRRAVSCSLVRRVWIEARISIIIAE